MDSPAVPVVAENESDLLRRLRAGDDKAYAEIVRAHGGRLLAVARRYLGEEEARDAVQDAFISAFRGISSFNGQSKLVTWLHRIVVNAALVRLRTRRRKPETSIETMLPRFQADGHLDSPVVEWRTPHDDYERSELQKLVRDSIAKLPESYRLVLMLRDIEELDTQEVADALDITPGNVKVRLHRARLALRELLDPVRREEKQQ